MCHSEVPNVSKLQNCADITAAEGPRDFTPDVFSDGGGRESIRGDKYQREKCFPQPVEK